jgi:WD40 repeat protein
VVWERGGSPVADFAVPEWVHAVRWIGDTELLAGAGMPRGAEASGTVWVADLDTVLCVELPALILDRPITMVTLIQPDAAQKAWTLLALARDGGLHLVRYRGGEPPAEPWSTTLRAAGVRGLPKASVPLPDGSFCVATDAGVYRITVVPDGADYRCASTWLGGWSLLGRFRLLGATSVAVDPGGSLLAVGTPDGNALLLRLGRRSRPVRVHRGPAPVTSVAISDDARHVAVGDRTGRVAVYRTRDRRRTFDSGSLEPAVATRVDEGRVAILYRRRLELVDPADPGGRRKIRLDGSLAALDFDIRGDLAVVLSQRSTARALVHGSVLQILELRSGTLLRVQVPPGAEMLSSAETTLLPCAWRRVRLIPGGPTPGILLGSDQGIVSFGAPDLARGCALVVPCPPAVAVLSENTPAIRCGGFVADQEGRACLAGYATHTTGHGAIAGGECRLWTLPGQTASEPLALDAPVTAVALGRDGVAVVGTEQGKVCIARLEAGTGWNVLSELAHPHPLVALACSETDRVAALWADGRLAVWTGPHAGFGLVTFIEQPPRGVGFTDDGGRRLCVVDSGGGLHLWEAPGEPGRTPADPRPSFQAEPVLRAARARRAVRSERETALSALPAALGKEVRALAELAEQRAAGAMDHEAAIIAAIRSLTERFKVLVSGGALETAGALAESLPPAPNLILQLKRTMRETVAAAKLRAGLEGVIAEVKGLVERAELAGARRIAEGLPDEPEAIRTVKGQLLERIGELEASCGEAEGEVRLLVQRLAAAGFSDVVLARLARDNNIDRNNVWQYRALLQALLERVSR